MANDTRRLERELRDAQARLQEDLDATRRLLRVGTLFLHESNLESVLGEIVETAIAITGADFGNMQLRDRESGDLKIVAHRGFPQWWLDFWNRMHVGHGACGAALQQSSRVVVHDVERDPIFEGAALEMQKRAGVRAVQSTPLVSRSGAPIGIISTHFREPHVPSAHALALMDLLARQATDILERAHAERDLRDGEARLRALVDTSSDVLYRMSPDWTEMRQLTSRGFLAEAENQTQWLERYVVAEDRARVQAAIAKAIRTKGPFELEHRVVRADGSTGWTWSRAVPVMDEHGEIHEWFGAASDVTARKRAELELAEANRLLRETDRRKNEFLAVLSHELRNPLAPIRTGLDVITRVPAGSAQAERALAIIHRQFDHLSRLIDELLDVTRITSGKITLKRAVLDLNDLARRTVEDHRDACTRAGLSIDVQVATTPVRIDGDATRLEQVFGNLIDNAVKYTPRGGRIAVSVDTDAASGTGRLRVRDMGRGVSPELVPHLFEPFVQADKSLDRKEGGLGLGLAVAKMIVVLHGGTIAVASPGPGMGTTFTVTLPLEGAPAALDAQSTNESIARPKRVLVIDDNVDTSDMLRMLLELEGYDVDVAADGAAGIEHARVFSPDVILCDIGLPVMNGYEVARTLRTDKQLGNVKLVAVTGYGSREDVERAKDAGFDVHVTKPIDSDQLVAQVGTLTDDAPAARRRIVRGGSRRIQARARRAKI